jgi:hypothetical protein
MMTVYVVDSCERDTEPWCSIKGGKIPLLAYCFILVFCFAYFSTMTIHATFYSETSVNPQQSTSRYIPDSKTHRIYRCDNLTPCTLFSSLATAPYS